MEQATPGLPALRKSIESADAHIERLAAIGPRAASTSALLQEASVATGRAIAALPSASGPERYGVVFGADRMLQEAQQQIEAGRRVGATNSRIFLRQRSYRSVAVFEEAAEARTALERIRTANDSARDAYVVNLGSWCPGARPDDGVTDCGL